MSAPALERPPSAPRQGSVLIAVVVALVAGHLALVASGVGIGPEHIAGDLAIIALAVAGRRWTRVRALTLALLPFWGTGAAYEAVKVLLPWRGAIHIADVHALELSLFGVPGPNGALTTISHALQSHTLPALDIAAGLAYIAYFLLPLGLVLWWIWRRDELRAQRLAWAFLLTNLVGFTIQILFPVAPPWYVDAYGLGPAVLDAAPSAAGAARFDAALGISYFSSFYTRNVNVFGAMPSLHVAYPTLAALASARLGLRWALPTAALAASVGFAALYLNHHYLLDVIAGVSLAALCYALVSLVQRRALARRSER